MQALIAFFIVGNFVSSIVEAEMNPKLGTKENIVLQTIDYCFTGIFTLELALNMFVHWWKPFVEDGWSVTVAAKSKAIPHNLRTICTGYESSCL
eukprot:3085458-Rhodomonas_salina.3